MPQFQTWRVAANVPRTLKQVVKKRTKREQHYIAGLIIKDLLSRRQSTNANWLATGIEELLTEHHEGKCAVCEHRIACAKRA